MASNLRVDSIVPATGSSVSIGTAIGGVSIPGVLTYEDVTNVDSVGVITARDGLRVTGITTITSGNIQINAGGNTTQAIFSGNGGSGTRGLSIITESVGAQDEGVILNARASGTTGRIKLQTNSTTALTIDGTGSNGNITANTGNIIIGTAGKGIDYSAQSASSESGASTDAELLNHYEQGTWTPQMWRTGYNSEITLGSGNRSGRFIRVGNLLHISFYWYNPSLSESNGSIWVVRGLPFNIHTGSPSQFVMGGYYYFENGNSQGDSDSGAGMYRWQANANFSSNTLTLYGHDRDQNANGGVEFSGTGTLSIP